MLRRVLAARPTVPLFVTYIDSVFAGATSDMVQLRYTWLVSTSVTTVKSSDKFGIMEVVDVDSDGKSLTLNNTDSTLSLTQDSTIDIMGNMKFKVADQAGVLRFYPMVEYVIGEGVTPTPGPGTPVATVVGTPVMTPLANATVTTPEGNVTVAAAEATTAAAAAATTKGEPGFEAIFAIAGLLAVAFLVLRQKK